MRYSRAEAHRALSPSSPRATATPRRAARILSVAAQILWSEILSDLARSERGADGIEAMRSARSPVAL